MRVQVDQDVCIGSTSCADLCPEVFEIVDGVSTVKVGEVPPDLEDKAREAVDACPVSAISVVEE